MRKRKNGKLLSYYESTAVKAGFDTDTKQQTSLVIKGLYIGLACAAAVLIMLAVWYF